MQENRYLDEQGRENIRRQFFIGQTKEELREMLRTAYNDAVATLPNIIKLTQRQIDLNDPCPCGRNRSFKKCCYWKLLQSPPAAITKFMKD